MFEQRCSKTPILLWPEGVRMCWTCMPITVQPMKAPSVRWPRPARQRLFTPSANATSTWITSAIWPTSFSTAAVSEIPLGEVIVWGILHALKSMTTALRCIVKI